VEGSMEDEVVRARVKGALIEGSSEAGGRDLK
jgi:hypothetical protein